MLWLLALLALTANVQARAVNISNTWMLPEEGFPVFYRYFRDRISWYKADAVCQFHHANLVTVDTTAQYDAVRAYLKELDITSAVWVGLIRSNPDGDFTWTDYRGLSSDGYWSSAPDAGAAPLCAAADPAADYRWEARACGGPMVASFICELPVPQWASGSQGCMIKSLPALTILYLPESAAVQLTADCGLAGVKKVECTGNVKREDLLKELSCAGDTDETITTPAYELTTGTPWTISTDVSYNQQTSQDFTDEDASTSQLNTDGESSPNKQTSSAIFESKQHSETTPIIEYHTVVINKDIDTLADDDDLKTKSTQLHTFNLESNDIPKLPEKHNFITEEETDKLESEKSMQQKMLHDELARLGNTRHFEKIFTQSSDHFIPPLVMAKSKIIDDMAELSIHEKQAQQLAVEHNKRYENINDTPNNAVILHQQSNMHTTMQEDLVVDFVTSSTIRTPTDITTTKFSYKEKENKDMKNMKISPKKYNEKYYDPKSKNMKLTDKFIKKRIEKATDINIPQLNYHNAPTTMESTITTPTQAPFINDNFHPLEISVALKEPAPVKEEVKSVHSTETTGKVYIAETKYKNSELAISATEIKPLETGSMAQSPTEIMEKLTHKIVKITIPSANNENTARVIEIATLMPVFKETSKTENYSLASTTYNTPKSDIFTTPEISVSTENLTTKIAQEASTTSAPLLSTSHTKDITTEENISDTTEHHFTSTSQTITNIMTELTTNAEAMATSPAVNVSVFSDDIKSNATETGSVAGDETTESVDDFESPLLSGASEPLHRPNRSRRPQNQNHVKKFNPFRMLG